MSDSDKLELWAAGVHAETVLRRAIDAQFAASQVRSARALLRVARAANGAASAEAQAEVDAFAAREAQRNSRLLDLYLGLAE